MLNSYPKVYNLGHPNVDEMLTDEVIVEEKVDGSQFSFGVFVLATGERVLKIRSKGADILPEAPPTMFAKAVETVIAKQDLLVPGWVYRGEVLDKPKHNTLMYDRVPAGNIILFDITVGVESFASRGVKEQVATTLGLEVVPILYAGKVESAQQLRGLLDTVSVLGGQKIEGVVVKNYNRYGRDGKPLFGKFVSEAFKEVHGQDWRDRNPTKGDVVEQLIEKYRTPARWAKAVQHLREASLIEGSPRDIGPLIKEAQRDFDEECSAEIAQALLKQVLPKIRKGVLNGLPEWYKEQLMEQQFADPVEVAVFNAVTPEVPSVE